MWREPDFNGLKEKKRVKTNIGTEAGKESRRETQKVSNCLIGLNEK